MSTYGRPLSHAADIFSAIWDQFRLACQYVVKRIQLVAAPNYSGSASSSFWLSNTHLIRIGWNKFRQLVPLLINKDISFIVREILYSSCVRSSMLHGSETWLVRKENEVALQQAEMRMIRCMCGNKLQDRVPSKELRERLVLDDIGQPAQKKHCQYKWKKEIWKLANSCLRGKQPLK